MVIAAKPTPSNDQVVRLHVSWSAYESLVDSLGDHNHVRLTYDGDVLEIMSPGSKHDVLAATVDQMLTVLALEWQVSLTNYRSTTFKTKPRGFEVDQTYYVGAIKNRIHDVWNIDIAVDPPPDLLVEIDITNSSSDKLPIYAALSVPEVWHYTQRGFSWFAFAQGQYVAIQTSRVIAGLPLAEFARRLADVQPGDNLAFLAAWQQWLRDNRHLHAST